MKKAFTIIELIIVLIIIGIISSIFIGNFNTNPLTSDKKYLVSKLYEKKNAALMYSHVNEFTNWEEFNNYNNTCLNLDITLERLTGISQIDEEEISLQHNKYFINQETKISIHGLNSEFSKICFDFEGAPYDGNYYLENKIKDKIIIELKNKNLTEYIYILPNTGFISF